MQTFKFGDIETKIDTADADFMERFEEESEAVAKESEKIEKELEKTGKRSEFIRKSCGCAFAYFDRLFGEGTYQLMFGDTVNMRMCNSALYALFDTVEADQKEYNEEVRLGISNRVGNRSGRRAAKKASGK